jgi:hypothetical protein
VEATEHAVEQVTEQAEKAVEGIGKAAGCALQKACP